jgi:hypothetical protein
MSGTEISQETVIPQVIRARNPAVLPSMHAQVNKESSGARIGIESG